MKILHYLVFTVAMSLAFTLRAELDISHHRSTYEGINARLDSLQPVSASIKSDDGVIALSGWIVDGAIAKWLTTDKTFVPQGEDYAGLTEKLNADAATFIAALENDTDSAAKAPGNLTTITGTFLGIEQGDYFHWKMRAADGGEISFMVLRPDESVQSVLDDPEKFVGRRCQVQTLTTTEDLESAGGKLKVEHVLAVIWLPAN